MEVNFSIVKLYPGLCVSLFQRKSFNESLSPSSTVQLQSLELTSTGMLLSPFGPYTDQSLHLKQPE